MFAKTASDEIDNFGRAFIRRKACQFATQMDLSAAERHELEQDLLLNLIRRTPRFNAAAGRWTTFVRLVTERCLASRWQRWGTGREQFARRLAAQPSLNSDTGHSSDVNQNWHDADNHARRLGVTVTPIPDTVGLKHDLAKLLKSLSPAEQSICERLKLDSVAHVARDLGIPRTTLNDMIRKMRLRFERAGLEIYHPQKKPTA